MTQNKVILQNTIASLEAQKQQIYNEAYNKKMAELKTSLDTYMAEEIKKRDEALAVLKTSYDEAVKAKAEDCATAIATRKQGLESEANIYATTQTTQTDNLIAKMKSLIEQEA